ncbi:unnamed protein product, partial [Pylaiella littoralis]
MSVAGAVTNAGSDGKTLLHCAAMSGQTNVIAELLAAGANPYARCSSGETPLDLAGRLLDQNTNLPVVPPPPPASFGAPFLEKRGGGVSPTFINTPKQPQGGNARGIFVGSPVHSPGWPSPRGGVGGFTPRWSPGEPMKCSSAAGGAFATMPPTPPQISSRTVGGCAGLRPQSSATVEVAGVAWLGSETTASTDPPDAAAVAVAGGDTAFGANLAFFGQECRLNPATEGRLWAERVRAGDSSPL